LAFSFLLPFNLVVAGCIGGIFEAQGYFTAKKVYREA
jgi:hypothetical protein